MARERSNGEKGRNLCCNVAVLTWSEEREGEREREREINSKKLSEEEEKKMICRSVQSLSPPQ